jgi:hypothetical protein
MPIPTRGLSGVRFQIPNEDGAVDLQDITRWQALGPRHVARFGRMFPELFVVFVPAGKDPTTCRAGCRTTEGQSSRCSSTSCRSTVPAEQGSQLRW